MLSGFSMIPQFLELFPMEHIKSILAESLIYIFNFITLDIVLEMGYLNKTLKFKPNPYVKFQILLKKMDCVFLEW